MKRIDFLGTLLTSATIVLVGCGGGGDALEGDDVSPEPAALRGGQDAPPAGANGMSPSCFWALGSQQALRTLGGAALDQGNGVLPAIPVTQIAEGCRVVLRKTVACALPAGTSLMDPVTGESYPGWWGIASSWKTAALDPNGRRDITACLGQTLNASGTPVPILLEGPNQAVAQNATLDATYSLKESTVFGDLFSSTTPLSGLLPAFNLFVCWEDLLPQSCAGAGLPLLEQRICDDVILCGMVSLGPCSLSCSPNGPYNQCRPLPLTPYWTQTVRVRLDPATCK